MNPARMSAYLNAFENLRGFMGQHRPIERCELCAKETSANHEHLIEPGQRRLFCACAACALLFSGPGRKFKRAPRRVLALPDFRMSDAQWESLMVPISMAFFFKSTPEAKVIALYPSPAGATESLLSFEAWNDIEGKNPALQRMEPDVEALLINRIGYEREVSAPEYFLVPIDKCYQLVGLIRFNWKGLSGGSEVWRRIGEFFEGLRSHPSEVANA